MVRVLVFLIGFLEERRRKRGSKLNSIQAGSNVLSLPCHVKDIHFRLHRWSFIHDRVFNVNLKYSA